MEKVKAFYELSNKRQQIEEQLSDYDLVISELRTEAKKLKKGSSERQDLMKRANDLKNDNVYIKLQIELKILNYCINTVYYN
ncbi:hypothetical protein [Clostridium botulinum]|uniref:hypothetical protein n=1 Tax=Clostridium botulinum TaxID=1491 RepID=UPI0019684CB8|nr:hypothetical protein [Clostridium botulinum]